MEIIRAARSCKMCGGRGYSRRSFGRGHDMFPCACLYSKKGEQADEGKKFSFAEGVNNLRPECWLEEVTETKGEEK